MTSVEMVESALKMLKRLGYRPKRVRFENGALELDGLELLPPSAAEVVQESEKKRSLDEEHDEALRVLGVR